jgi:hypothetical protein
MREAALLARLFLITGAGAGIVMFIAQWPFWLVIGSPIAGIALALRVLWAARSNR